MAPVAGGVVSARVLLAIGAILVNALLGLSDARTRRLPDGLVGALALLGLADASLAALGVGAPAPLVTRVAWALTALCALTAAELAWRRLRGVAGIAGGDVKMIAAIALWAGPDVALVVGAACAVASLVALVRGARTFALGPYLAVFSCLQLVHTLVNIAV